MAGQMLLEVARMLESTCKEIKNQAGKSLISLLRKLQFNGPKSILLDSDSKKSLKGLLSRISRKTYVRSADSDTACCQRRRGRLCPSWRTAARWPGTKKKNLENTLIEGKN